MQQYAIILTPDPEDGGYTVTVPALPGLVTEGDTRGEALRAAHEAIAFHLECLAEEAAASPDTPHPRPLPQGERGPEPEAR